MERVTSAELRAAVKLTSFWKCHYKQLSLLDRIDVFHSRSGSSTKPVLTIESLLDRIDVFHSRSGSSTKPVLTIESLLDRIDVFHSRSGSSTKPVLTIESLLDRIDAFHSRSGPSTKPVLTIERLVSNKTLVQSRWVNETLKFVIKKADEGPISILKRQQS